MSDELDAEAVQDGLDDMADDDSVVEVLTVVEATNADRQSLLFGHYEERQALTRPEMGSNTVYQVKRLYEPVDWIVFDDPMTEEEVLEWINEEPDHEALSDFDWEAYRSRPALEAAAQSRATLLNVLSTVNSQLAQISADSEETEQQLSQLQSGVAETIGSQPAVQIDRVESPELGDE